MDTLSFAIEELYRVFARYPLRAHIHSCPHCQLDEAERRLHQAPLRALTVNQLSTFAFRAMTTFGDENDFRHFLPRLAELASLDGRSYELPLIANKLVYGNWGEWPAEEQRAILSWFDALEDRALSAIASDDLESLLDARSNMGRRMEPLLERALNADSPFAIECIAQLVLRLASQAQHGSLGSPTEWMRAHRAELDDAFCRALERWSEEEVPSAAPAADVLLFAPFL